MSMPLGGLSLANEYGGVTLVHCLAVLVAQIVLNRLTIVSLGPPLTVLIVTPAVSAGILCLIGRSSSWYNSLTMDYTIFYFLLCCSVFAYRCSPLHPMAKFPGPFLARSSKAWAIWVSLSGRQYTVFEHLHKKYGTFVRTGPNELSISDPTAITAVLGLGGLPRGRFYVVHADPDAPKNLVVLDGHEHTSRKRLWKRGMSPEALQEYSTMIAERSCQLIDRIPGAEVKEPVDLVTWFKYWSFDCMGDIMFGGGFEMLRDGSDREGLWDLIEGYFFASCLFNHMSWIMWPLTQIPMVARRFVKLRTFGATVAAMRVKNGSIKKDLWSHLIDEAGHEKMKPSAEAVISDGTLAVITGADTTAPALASLFFYLLSNAAVYSRVRAEIDDVFLKGNDLGEISKYDNLVFLDACIHETLRLLPPVPTGGRRRVTEGMGGQAICERFIPEGTEVYIPPYVLHRDPKNFSPRPQDFWPDRWLPGLSLTMKGKESDDGSGIVHNATAFLTFSYGPAMCVAKNLARLEIKILVSHMLRRFDVQMIDVFDKEEWLDSLRDYYVLRPTKPLKVAFRSRESI